MRNPMIPEKKREDVGAEAQRKAEKIQDENQDPNLELLRKAWDFRNPVHISGMIVPDEKTVCSAISYCSIAASCGILNEEQMQTVKNDLLKDLQTVTEYQRAYMILNTIIRVIRSQNTHEGQIMLGKISEILGIECNF